MTAGVVGALVLSGCRSWQPTSLPREVSPRTLRVTLEDGSVVPVNQAVLEGDTFLVGLGRTGERLVFPVGDVAGVRSKRFDGAMTFWAAVLSLPLLYLGAVIMVMSGGYT